MMTSSIEVMVDRRVREWLARQNTLPSVPQHILPVITVSREHGSQGKALGQLLAAELSFDYWDHRLLDEMAHHAKFSVGVFEALDEHRRSAIEATIAMFTSQPGMPAYMAELHRAIQTIVHHGRAVIIGRGAQFITAPDEALRVRVVAPKDARVNYLAEVKGMGHQEAAREIERLDRDHVEFVHYELGRDAESFDAYDVVVNTATMDLEGAKDLIVRAYTNRFGDIVPVFDTSIEPIIQNG